MRDYEDREPDLDAMDQRAEELYDEHRDALAHLPTEILLRLIIYLQLKLLRLEANYCLLSDKLI